MITAQASITASDQPRLILCHYQQRGRWVHGACPELGVVTGPCDSMERAMECILRELNWQGWRRLVHVVG